MTLLNFIFVLDGLQNEFSANVMEA